MPGIKRHTINPSRLAVPVMLLYALNPGMAGRAERLPVTGIPEESRISAVRLDMIDNRSRRVFPNPLT
jgi:hypothetical protein